MKKLIVLSVCLLSSFNSLFAMSSAVKGNFDYKATLLVKSVVKGQLIEVHNVIDNIVGDSNFSVSYRLENGNASVIQERGNLLPKNWYSLQDDLEFKTSIIPYSVGPITLVLKVKNKRGVEKEQLINFEVSESVLMLPVISSVEFKPLISSGGDRASWERLQLFTNLKLVVPSYESNLVSKISVVVSYNPIEPYTKNSFVKEFAIDYPAMVAGFTTVLIGEDYKEASRGALTSETTDFPYITTFMLKVVYNTGEVIYSVPKVKSFEAY